MKPIVLTSVIAVQLCVGAAVAWGQWQPAAAFPTAGAARAYAVGVRDGSTLYAVGGTPFSGGEGAAHALPSGATTFSAVAGTEGALYHVGAARDGLGRIIVFGGVTAGGTAGEAYWWTPDDGNNGGIDDRSGQAPDQLFAVATDAQGRVYSIGGGLGAAATAQSPNSTRVERYDPIADAWSVIAPLPTAVADAAACFDGNGHVLVIGGYGATGQRIGNVARYDVLANQWSDDALPDLPVALAGHRAALGSDGRVYVVGGEAGATVASTWILDLATLTWSAGPTMATPRRHFGLVLGADDHLYALGGWNDAGGTALSERLFTPPCPTVTAPPMDATAYLGASFSLAVAAVGGPPLAYAWRKDGVPLGDGPSAGGGVVAGALTPQLAILHPGAADAGDYDCVVSNACGATTSAAASIELVPPAQVPVTFTVKNLHPAGALGSAAAAVDGDQVGGSGTWPVGPYPSLSRPILWSATTGAWLDLTPANSVGGGIGAMAGGTVAGWYWWPYTTPQGTGYYKHSCVWSGSPTALIDIQPTGWETGSVGDTDGAHHVGTLRFDETSTNVDGFYWPQSNKGPVKLTPSAAWGSTTNALDGPAQYGSVHLGYGVVHAARWSGGSAATFADLNPAGATWSFVDGAGGGQQVGRATLGGLHHAGLWSGNAATFVPLHPAGASTSSAADCEAGLQVGAATIGGVGRAMLWAGTAQSALDLHAWLGPEYGSSSAQAIDVASDGTVTIAGSAYRITTGRTEAIVWRGSPLPLSSDLAALSVAAGGQVHLTLAAGSAFAGRTYFLLGGASGTSPGVGIAPGVTLPLNPDVYTQFLASAPNTLIVPSLGTLDGAGRAVATFSLPGGVVSLPGPLVLDHAYVVFDASGWPVFASNALRLTLEP